MTYQRFVQVGRIAYVAIGPDNGKLVVIVDVIDQNRALVDGPTTGVKRQSMNLKYLHLTKFHVKIPHGAREKTVRNAWIKAEIDKKWGESTWAKKIAAKKLRSSMGDFDRFKLMKAKQARNSIIRLEMGKLRKEAKKVKKEKTTTGKAKKPAAKKPAAK